MSDIHYQQTLDREDEQAEFLSPEEKQLEDEKLRTKETAYADAQGFGREVW